MSHSRAVMTSQKTDIHYTPVEVLQLVHEFWPQGIDLDPASDEVANMLVRAMRIYTEADNGLDPVWHADRLFMNPPYSLAAKFIGKLRGDHLFGFVKEAITLTKADISTKWFADIWGNASAICFVDHRLRFGTARTGAPFCSAIAYFGPDKQRFSCLFSQMGPVATSWTKVEK